MPHIIVSLLALALLAAPTPAVYAATDPAPVLLTRA